MQSLSLYRVIFAGLRASEIDYGDTLAFLQFLQRDGAAVLESQGTAVGMRLRAQLLKRPYAHDGVVLKAS